MAEITYAIYTYADTLKPGDELLIKHLFRPEIKDDEIKGYLDMSIEDLERELMASVAAEEAFFKQLRKMAEPWEEMAAKTCALRAAIEYQKMPKIKHISNQ